ncbi:MAG: hypothetical protein AB2A00_12555 [Myxococcota bacterium]
MTSWFFVAADSVVDKLLPGWRQGAPVPSPEPFAAGLVEALKSHPHVGPDNDRILAELWLDGPELTALLGTELVRRRSRRTAAASADELRSLYAFPTEEVAGLGDKALRSQARQFAKIRGGQAFHALGFKESHAEELLRAIVQLATRAPADTSLYLLTSPRPVEVLTHRFDALVAHAVRQGDDAMLLGLLDERDPARFLGREGEAFLAMAEPVWRWKSVLLARMNRRWPAAVHGLCAEALARRDASPATGADALRDEVVGLARSHAPPPAVASLALREVVTALQATPEPAPLTALDPLVHLLRAQGGRVVDDAVGGLLELPSGREELLWFVRGVARHLTSAGDSSVITCFQAATARAPDFASAWFQLGCALREKAEQSSAADDWQGAREAFGKARRLASARSRSAADAWHDQQFSTLQLDLRWTASDVKDHLASLPGA